MCKYPDFLLRRVALGAPYISTAPANRREIYFLTYQSNYLWKNSDVEYVQVKDAVDVMPPHRLTAKSNLNRALFAQTFMLVWKSLFLLTIWYFPVSIGKLRIPTIRSIVWLIRFSIINQKYEEGIVEVPAIEKEYKQSKSISKLAHAVTFVGGLLILPINNLSKRRFGNIELLSY